MKIENEIKHQAGLVLMMRTWTIVFSLIVALPLTILSNNSFEYQNVVWAFVGHFLILECLAYLVGRRYTWVHGAYVLFHKKLRTFRKLRRNLGYMRTPVQGNPSLDEEREALYILYLDKFKTLKSDLKLLKACATSQV